MVEKSADDGLYVAAGLTKLRSLDLGSIKRMSDDGLKRLAPLTQLQSLDLAAANREQLLLAGLPEENIETAVQCVCCQSDWFFSYRRDGGETGRQAGFIMLNLPE